MTPVPFASTEDIHDIVRRFAALQWPIDRARLSEVASELGWTVQFEVPKGTYFLTGRPFDKARAEALISDGVVGQVTVDVSGRVGDEDEPGQEDLSLAFTRMCADLEESLGAAAATRGGSNPRVSWDLDNGGRIALARLETVVKLIVLQQAFADIERFEESRGVSPDRDPLGK